MTLSAARNTLQLGNHPKLDLLSFPVAANTAIQQGQMVAISLVADATLGFLVPAGVKFPAIVVGMSEMFTDNTTGNAQGNSGLAGGATARVRQGVFKWLNSSS